MLLNNQTTDSRQQMIIIITYNILSYIALAIYILYYILLLSTAVVIIIYPSTIMNSEAQNDSSTDLKSGPFAVLYNAVKGNTQILVNVRNNHKILGRVKAYDRHMNL